MNPFTALKNFIFSAPKTADDIFDKDKGLLAKAGGFINDLHYSDAEKAEDVRQMGRDAIDFVKATFGENTEKSKTRRTLATLWIKAQLGLILMTAICIPFDDKLAKSFYELATCNLMLYGTGGVMVYFFGSYGWGTYIKKKAQ